MRQDFVGQSQWLLEHACPDRGAQVAIDEDEAPGRHCAEEAELGPCIVPTRLGRLPCYLDEDAVKIPISQNGLQDARRALSPRGSCRTSAR
jgi:hypothetical protein